MNISSTNSATTNSATTNSATPSSATTSVAASNARAIDGDYKTKGPGHEVKDSDGDYKPTKPATVSTASSSPAARSSSGVLAALSTQQKGG